MIELVGTVGTAYVAAAAAAVTKLLLLMLLLIAHSTEAGNHLSISFQSNQVLEQPPVSFQLKLEMSLPNGLVMQEVAGVSHV